MKALVEVRYARPPHSLVADVDAFNVDRLLTRAGRGSFAFDVVRAGVHRDVLREGRIAVIQSTTNVLPYVGIIKHLEEDAGAATVEVSGDNYASVLYGMALNRTAPQGDMGAGRIAEKLLEEAQGMGRSAFLRADVATGTTLQGTIDFGTQLLGAALDSLAGRVNDEWWVEHIVSRATLTHVFKWAKSRGHERPDILLQEGVHFSQTQYKRDATGSPRSVMAVGGAGPIASRPSVVVAYNPATASAKAAQVNAARADGLVTPSPGPLLARDVVELRALDSTDAVLADVARRAFERPVVASESLGFTVTSGIWPRLSPGDTVRARWHSLNYGGLDRMVRINAMQPDESTGECDVDVEVV